MRELHSDSSKEFASVTSILRASWEEEVCSKTLLVIELSRDGAGDSGLPSASHAI